MGPDEKWEVAVAKAPKCLKRASVPSQPPDTGSSNTSKDVKRSSAGEEGAMVEAILDFEGSRGQMEERKGWGETQSERAVEELHQWLLQGNQPANPPLPHYG